MAGDVAVEALQLRHVVISQGTAVLFQKVQYFLLRAGAGTGVDGRTCSFIVGSLTVSV